MKIVTAGAVAAAVFASAFAAQAQTPGLKMQEKGSVSGSPGASGYAPGHRMQENGSVKGTTGASGYAPGHTTTGAGINGNADIKAGKSGLHGGANAGVKAK